MKRPPRQPTPSLAAAAGDDERELRDGSEPPGGVKGQGRPHEPPSEGGDEEPGEGDVEAEGGGGYGREHHDLALSLQELGGGVGHGVGEVLGDHPRRQPPGLR